MLKWRVVLLAAILIFEARQGCPAFLGTGNAIVVDEADDLLNDEGQIFVDTNSDGCNLDDNLFDVQETRFSCIDYSYPGYYADIETECQIFHICQAGGRKDSFLCPEGTIFNQEKLVCDWKQNFDCGKSREFYFVNEVVAAAMRDVDQSQGIEFENPRSFDDEEATTEDNWGLDRLV